MTKFNANCTLPETIVNYVSQPNTRGTLDILWSCLGTILLCTWSVQHLNVPAVRSAHGKHSKRASVLKQTGMMVFTLLAPEFLLLKAIGEFAGAVALTERMEEPAKADGVPWSRVHSFFTNMGGFVIRFNEDTPDVKPLPRLPTKRPMQDEGLILEEVTVVDPRMTLKKDCEKGTSSKITNICTAATITNTNTHNDEKEIIPNQRLCRMITARENALPPMQDKNSLLVGRIISKRRIELFSRDQKDFNLTKVIDHVFNLIRLRGQYWALDGPQLILAREMGIISKIPNVPASEIEDKSNGDFLVKFLAVIHAGWQIIQLIMRWAEDLPASQAEVVTVAFSVCAFCTYLLYWSKPQDVKTPYFVMAERYPSLREVDDLAARGPSYIAAVFTGHQYSIPEHGLHSHFGDSRPTLEGGILSWLGGLVCAILFGLLHCIAWSFRFPTPVERLLWRLAAVITTVLPILFAVRGLCLVVAEKWGRRKGRKERKKVPECNFFAADNPLMPLISLFLTVLYVSSRLYLLIETFRSLFFLLPGTFKTA